MTVGHGMTKRNCQPTLRLQVETAGRGYAIRNDGIEAAYFLPFG